MAINPKNLRPLLNQAAGVAASVLSRTFLLEKGTFNLIPRILMVFDVITEENPEFSSDVTQHPVEDGQEVTDHIQLKNPTLTLKGTISSTPIDMNVAIANLLAGGISFITSSQFRSNLLNTGLSNVVGVAGAALLGNAANASATLTSGAIDAIARAALLDAWERKARFDVVTQKERYSDMVIERLGFPRDGNTGRQLVFELSLVHIRTVSPLQVFIKNVAENVVTSASGDSNLGNQAAGGVADQTASKVGSSGFDQAAAGVRQ